MSAAVLAIHDVTLIDGSGGPPQPHSTVVVRDRTIQAVGPVRAIRIPKGARVIAGKGKFLIPGLWDMHVHLWHPENQLPKYVANGVTGVRDMGSDFARVSQWRRDIIAGKAIGPHVLTPGPVVAGKPSTEPKLPTLVAATPDDARRIVDQLEDMQVDFIKILTDVPREAYIALTERARHQGMDFAGHIPSAVTAWDAVESRQNSIEHMFGLFRVMVDDPAKPLDTFNESKARAFFERSALLATYHCPSLTLWERMTYTGTVQRVEDQRMKQVPAAIRATWPKPDDELKKAADADAATAERQLAFYSRLVRLMKESRVAILAGTDTGDPYTVPGATLHDELALLVKAGLTPMEALLSATSVPSKFIGWEDTAGQLKPAFDADFVLLDADPLADIRNVARIAGVAVRGRYFDRVQLARLRAADAR
jgi:hypothetical protein